MWHRCQFQRSQGNTIIDNPCWPLQSSLFAGIKHDQTTIIFTEKSQNLQSQNSRSEKLVLPKKKCQRWGIPILRQTLATVSQKISLSITIPSVIADISPAAFSWVDLDVSYCNQTRKWNIWWIYEYVHAIYIYIHIYIYNTVYIYIWVNYNNSLTWIKAIWGWFPLLTMIPVRSQWGRYNLPRYIYIYPYKFNQKNDLSIWYAKKIRRGDRRVSDWNPRSLGWRKPSRRLDSSKEVKLATWYMDMGLSENRVYSQL